MDAQAKPWGTIFLDSGRETTLDNLEAMQAPLQQARKAKEAEQAYLERVRLKATERAKEILAHAYTERQNLLDEAAQEARVLQEEAAGLRDEAQRSQESAQHSRAEADNALRIAKAERDAGREQGFAQGMDSAQEELARTRTALGATTACLLQAIHTACGQIFDNWRQELVSLFTCCVEKGTALVLEERHAAVLERLLVDAARRMEQRDALTLRVHPDDEDIVNDILLAVREHVPGLDQWMIVGDPALQSGGFVVESSSGAVDSRLELRRELVETILHHLTLPESAIDHAAQSHVDTVYQATAAHLVSLVPMPEIIPENTHTQDIVETDDTLSTPTPKRKSTLAELEEELLPIQDRENTV